MRREPAWKNFQANLLSCNDKFGKKKGMSHNSYISIFDKSLLATNMFKVLFKPQHYYLSTAKNFEEIPHHLFLSKKIDLIVVNTNVFGRAFQRFYDFFTDEEAVKDVPKLFLCRDEEADSEWNGKLAGLSQSVIMMKPFSPTQFMETVEEILKEQQS